MRMHNVNQDTMEDVNCVCQLHVSLRESEGPYGWKIKLVNVLDSEFPEDNIAIGPETVIPESQKQNKRHTAERKFSNYLQHT